QAEADLEKASQALEKTDVVVFIGGVGTLQYFKEEKVMDLIRLSVRQRKLIGAICLAPSLLARAGVLTGWKATVWKSEGKTLTEKGATYVAEPVVVDGRFITADGPKAAPAFASAIIRWLRERAASQKKAEALLAEPKKLCDQGQQAEARKRFQAIYEEHKNDLTIASGALFGLGFAFYQEKKIEEAVKTFQKLNREYPLSDFFGMAQFNTGIILHKRLKKPRLALDAFKGILTGDCNDWDNTGNLMNPYRNYRYLALLNIGKIHMELREHGPALQAFLDSFHKGYFATHCGTCLIQATQRRENRTAEAASALTGLPKDDLQKKTMKKAAKADAYLLALGKAYLEAGEKERAKKTFSALSSAFPESDRLPDIPAVD
ncbi:MAG: DJ-1/PfpI family protein, partial [Planctomycetota bacterium]